MENDNTCETDAVTVASLQACLFPRQLTCSSSYFSNFFVKPCQIEEDDESKTKVKETFSFRDMLNVTAKDTPFTMQPPRWPSECQVLEGRIKHINYVPPAFEPYYVASGNECQPKPSGDECGVIVYQYAAISAVNYFSRSSVGGSTYLLPTDLCPEENCLKFESRFESGNLARAIRISPSYYELQLRADLYTNRHMQWFYFKITNTRKDFLYRFSITNFSKENSLYSEGMRPLMYSTKDSQLHSIGWRRCGQNIVYFCNDNASPDDPDQHMTYTLSFTVEFPHDNDEVYLANCYPYTYSDLQDYLLELSTNPVKSTFSTVRLLCKSLAGNNVYFVTITSPPVAGEIRKKKAVVLTARVHPGETPSSWMVKGFLDFLTSDTGPAKELRDKFIFKIVPMLNPDGVIVGNNRCSLSAKDLNRQYRTVMRDAYPSIWYTKLMVRRLLEECGVAMYCDLHAHSRKHDIFIYGCENRRNGDKRLQEQVFPLMLHKNTADKFSFESCKFRIQKAKEGTARVVMWMMGIANSYTMEASFAGSSLGNRVDTHFSTQDFEQMGRSFCQTLLDFYDEDPKKEKLRLKIIERLTKEGSNADEPTNIPLSDYSSDEGDTSSSSDEVGRDEEVEIIVPTPPPPSPVMALTKKLRKTKSHKTKATTRSPGAPRKPLPICKATLKLSLSEKENSNSSSDSENDNPAEKRITVIRRRKKKKRIIKKKTNIVQGFSDSEMQFEKSTRSITVFDLLPSENLQCQMFNAQRATPHSKVAYEKRNEITKQLAEVQAKLYTLKNKLWFGAGHGDAPLSWGNGTYYYPPSRPVSPQKQAKKPCKKNTKKMNSDKAKTESKMKTEQKSNPGKSQNGLRRQPAFEWTLSENVRLRKSKSLPDTTCLASSYQEKNRNKVNVEEDKKKKKKKRLKFAGKVKVLSNAKVFTHT